MSRLQKPKEQECVMIQEQLDRLQPIVYQRFQTVWRRTSIWESLTEVDDRNAASYYLVVPCYAISIINMDHSMSIHVLNRRSCRLNILRLGRVHVRLVTGSALVMK